MDQGIWGFPSRLSHEVFPRGFPTGLSHVPPWCASILDLKVEAVQGKQFPWNGLRLLQDSGSIDMTLEFVSTLLWRAPYRTGFPRSSVGKESACSAGHWGSIPGLGRSSGEGNGNPLWYSCLEDPMDRETWRAIVHGVTRVGHNLVSKPPPPEQAP